MFRNTRYFGKNDGKHNLYGELEYVEGWDGEGEDQRVEPPAPPDHDADEEEE